MANNELSTEAKILDAADSIFLLFGYHGTTLHQIATKAGVNTAAIHYYFRSKENIYALVLKNNLSLLSEFLNTKEYWPNHEFKSSFFRAINKNINIAYNVWFIVNEIKVNNLQINELIKTDEEINGLINSIFNNSSNLKIMKRLITFQFTEIINQDLKNNLMHKCE
ncbi:MAG: TetR/AcrR family transcriptional regulator [Bacteroidota bacterium]|nr:TetR/AcrR family transcriptional regulator [Bacteroidota bacterium]